MRITLAICLCAASASAQVIDPIAFLFNPQPDPPGFGLIALSSNQTVRLNVVCFDHQVGLYPPGPCRGTLMFHDAAGNVLNQTPYALKPGESTFLEFNFAPPPTDTVDLAPPHLEIDPCWLPGPGGRAVASAEVFDASGRLIHFANPAAHRMSEFNNSPTDPGAIVGFNPQPDPPGFGIVTLTGFGIRLTASCFDHPVNGFPPGPCRGTMMFHAADGSVLKQSDYDLKPGESTALEFFPSISTDFVVPVALQPCILPAPGGRAVPAVQLVNSNGDMLMLINPAADRMSQFQRQ